MFTARVTNEITDRLDAEFYNPKALDAIHKIHQLGEVLTLGELISEGYRVVYHGTDNITGLAPNSLLPFLSPTQIDSNGSISFEGTDLLPLYYRDQYPKGLGKAGELLIEVKGNVSKVAVIPDEFPKNLMISGSLYKATLSSKLDSHYAFAYLKSVQGQVLKDRLTSNTIINYIGKSDLYSIPVLVAKGVAQKYIGDKVRQAERLRAWAKELTNELNNLEKEIPAVRPTIRPKKSVRVAKGFLTNNRLDGDFYKQIHLDLVKQFDHHFIPFGQICSDFRYGASVAAKYVPMGSSGLTFIRGTDLEANRLDSSKFVSLHESLHEDVSSNTLSKGQILITRSGTVGVSAAVPEELEGAAYGSFIIRSNLRKGYIPEYISWYLNSWIGQQQFRRLENGAVQLNINISELSSIQIWNASSSFQSEVARIVVDRNIALELSNKLTLVAKSLVEALIEGQLTEQQLIQAESSETANRALLERLKTDGFDGKGETLFPDIDQLEQLLEEAADQ